MTGYKLLTSDFRPPIQGGAPIFDGACPFTTPVVSCDTSTNECAAGWNFVRDLATGFKIAGMWRTGRPNTVFLVEAADAVERANKCRAPKITFLRAATDEEIRAGLLGFSKVFGTHCEAMAEEQWLWWKALKRPHHDPEKVATHLQEALAARGLDWKLKEFKDEQAARDARDAWDARDARDAWAAWDARDARDDARDARDAWDARDARDAWDARDARDAWAAWAARDAWDDARDARDARDAWAAWAARDAWAAWAALTVSFAARSGWISLKQEHLTVGIRDAYLNGLAFVLPTGPNELGYVMESAKETTV